MATIAVIVFALTLLGGVTLAFFRIRRVNLPTIVPIGHGLLGLSGIVLLVVIAIRVRPAPSLLTAIGLFASAAVAGVLLANAHRNKKGSTALFISAHACLAVFGFIMLLIYTFGTTITPVGP